MSRQQIAIIGAGLAGLSAGIELQKKGIQTHIYEKAPWAGGVCTSWVRKGYRFDGCIHWMVGTNPNSPIFSMYEKVKALESFTKCYNPKSLYCEIEGKVYQIPMELEPFRTFLVMLSPRDEVFIDRLCNNILAFSSQGFSKVLSKYRGEQVSDFTKLLHSNIIVKILYSLMPPTYSMLGLIMMLSSRFTRNGGYPEGGSLEMITRMENYYKELGGKLHLNSEVQEIILESKLANAIRVNGDLIPVHAIISAGDVHNLIYDLLKDQNKHPQLNSLLKSENLFSSVLLVSFGLKKKLGIPFSIWFECGDEIEIEDGKYIRNLHARSFDFDKTAAGPNNSSVMVMIESKLPYWENLYVTNREEYKKEKIRIANEISIFLDKRYPSFIESIEIIDVATPVTYTRLANLYLGSYEGFIPTPRLLGTRIERTISTVSNLILCGQWTTPGGGIPTAIGSGIEASSWIEKNLIK